MEQNFLTFERLPMISDHVKLLIQSHIMDVAVLLAFGTNLSPLMLPITCLCKMSAFHYIPCLPGQTRRFKPIKPLRSTSLKLKRFNQMSPQKKLISNVRYSFYIWPFQHNLLVRRSFAKWWKFIWSTIHIIIV